MSDYRKPMKGETSRQYDRFQVFLELGAGRSLFEVADMLGLKLTTIQELSSKFDWFDRAAQYDQNLVIKRQQENEKKIEAMNDRYMKVFDLMLSKAVKGLQDVKPELVNVRDLTNMATQAFAGQRKIMGLDSDEKIAASPASIVVNWIEELTTDQGKDKS